MGGIVEDDFVKQAYAEISEQERDAIVANERVKNILRSRSIATDVLKVGDEEIRFRLTINKKMRKQVALFKTMSAEEVLDKPLYETVSALCTDAPWTDWKTWAIVDEEAEDTSVLDILLLMVAKITEHMEDVKSFRGKR